MDSRFIFRDIRPEEWEEASVIESICFPPHEACTPEHIRDRVQAAAEQFLVAEDKETGKLAGFLNGIVTKEERFRDEFFTQESLHDPGGDHVMLLGLDVLPGYRMQGLARTIVTRYAQRERKKGRKALVLTCLENKVDMYRKFGFEDLGLADSCWGGEEWHEMILMLDRITEDKGKEEE